MKEKLIEEVKSLPKFELTPVFFENGKRIDNFVAVTERESRYVVAMVSPKYSLVQFEEIFLPIIESIEEEITGNVLYYFGKAYMTIFPEGERYETENGRIGLVVKNSVDKSLSVVIQFAIKHDEVGMIFLPTKKMKEFRRKHLGNVKAEMDSVKKFVIDVRNLWKNFYERLHEVETDEEYAEEILKMCKFGKNAIRTIKSRLFTRKLNGEVKKPKLWELFVEMAREVGKGKYKSEIHRINKLNKISEVLYDVAMAEEI